MSYQNGKIYKLWSPSKNLVYYGSTTQTLSQRLSRHITQYNYYKCKPKNYCYAFLIIECEDYKIELIEEYPCNNKQQLCKKEGEYIKANECVNRNIAGRTNKEYHKDNKEKYDKIRNQDINKEYIKNYRVNHKQERNEYQKNYREIKKQNNAIYKWLTTTGIIQ